MQLCEMENRRHQKVFAWIVLGLVLSRHSVSCIPDEALVPQFMSEDDNQVLLETNPSPIVIVENQASTGQAPQVYIIFLLTLVRNYVDFILHILICNL